MAWTVQVRKQHNHLAFGLVMAGSLVRPEEDTGNDLAASHLLTNCCVGRPSILNPFLRIELSWISAARGALPYFTAIWPFQHCPQK